MPFTAPITPTDPANVARGARNAPAPSSVPSPQGGGMPPLNYYNAGNVTYLYDQNWNHIGQLPNHSMHMAQMARTQQAVQAGARNAPSSGGNGTFGTDETLPPGADGDYGLGAGAFNTRGSFGGTPGWGSFTPPGATGYGFGPPGPTQTPIPTYRGPSNGQSAGTGNFWTGMGVPGPGFSGPSSSFGGAPPGSLYFAHPEYLG